MKRERERERVREREKLRAGYASVSFDSHLFEGSGLDVLFGVASWAKLGDGLQFELLGWHGALGSSLLNLFGQSARKKPTENTS